MRGHFYGYTVSVEFCCSDMDKTWGDWILVGDRDFPAPLTTEVNIQVCVPHQDEPPSWYYHRIHFCPFCGEPVRVSLIESTRQERGLSRS